MDVYLCASSLTQDVSVSCTTGSAQVLVIPCGVCLLAVALQVGPQCSVSAGELHVQVPDDCIIWKGGR